MPQTLASGKVFVSMRFLVLSCCALLCVTASSNHSPEQLLSFAKTNEKYAQTLLFLSAKEGSNEAGRLLLENALVDKSKYWLEQLSSLNKTMINWDAESLVSEATFQLALLEKSKSRQKYWLKRAADIGHAKAQFELSLLLQDEKKRLDLLIASAKSNYPPALLTLGKYYYQNRDQNEALKWLERAAKYDAQSAFYLAGLHLQSGSVELANMWYDRAYLAGFDKAKAYALALGEQSVEALDSLFELAQASKTDAKALQCSQTLQFVAGDVHSLVQARAFKQAFEQDERLQRLPICINPVAWLESSELACDLAGESGRVNCDLRAFSELMARPTFSHLVVFAPHGKAYVQRGVMYLDRADVYSVFVHELAHFANFVDEYALSPSLAEYHCSHANAPNLMIESRVGDVDVNKLANWKALVSADENSQETLSIAPSKTCKHATQNSLKPSADITFLEHHDTNYIPELYLKLWQIELEKQPGHMAVVDEFRFLAERDQAKAALSFWSRLRAANSAENQAMLGLESSQSTLPLPRK
jgi:hypothetical protein